MDDEIFDGYVIDESDVVRVNDAVKSATAIMPGDIILPRREEDTHKGDYGRALIIGGSVGFSGAPVLSAKAASKTGAGLVYVGVPKAIYEIAAVKLDEEMPFPLPDKNGCLAGNAAGEILRRAKLCDACLLGPGLGANPRGGEPDDITELVHSITRIVETPLVLDADGLNAVAQNTDILRQALCPLVLTPHPGEFARLLGQPPGSIDGTGTQSQRVRVATDFARKYNCILVLKGHRTVIALPNGESYVNTTGGPAMAKGGTGDVLAGMITSFIAQGFKIVDAVIDAVYLHGLAGDMCAETLGEYSVAASDIINMLPQALKTVIES